MTTDADWHWDRYWQADRMSACPADGAAGNYMPAIHAGWKTFFQTFPDGARLLDIGTGNGAIAVIAQTVASELGYSFEIHGVDRADIEPSRYVQSARAELATIRFHARTAVEAMPFPPHHFDGISGQYALEYTDMPATVQELARVVKPGGRLRFVLHGVGAVPVEDATQNLQEVEFLTKNLALADKARTLMRAAFAFEQAGVYDAQLEDRARSARETYLKAARLADAYYPTAKCKAMFSDLLGEVRKSWDHRREFTLDQILMSIDSIDAEIQSHGARLIGMRNVALSRQAAEGLMKLFRASNCTDLVLDELRPPEDPRFWGWELSMRAFSPV